VPSRVVLSRKPALSRFDANGQSHPVGIHLVMRKLLADVQAEGALTTLERGNYRNSLMPRFKLDGNHLPGKKSRKEKDTCLHPE